MLERVLNLLDSVQRRPTMFFWPNDATALENFLAGVVCAYHVEGLSVTPDNRREAAESRGWEYTSNGAIDRMQAVGLSGKALLQEQVAVTAEAFRRASADRLPAHLTLRYRQDDLWSRRSAQIRFDTRSTARSARSSAFWKAGTAAPAPVS